MEKPEFSWTCSLPADRFLCDDDDDGDEDADDNINENDDADQLLIILYFAWVWCDVVGSFPQDWPDILSVVLNYVNLQFIGNEIRWPEILLVT